VRFASAALLEGDFKRIAALTEGAEGRKGADRDWLLFFRGFSQNLNRDFAHAADTLAPLAGEGREPLVCAVSAYLLDQILAKSLSDRGAELSALATTAKTRLVAAFKGSRWEALVEEQKADMHVVILGKLIADAGAWLYV